MAADRPWRAEEHAAGMLSLVGGTFDASEPGSAVLEETARREVAEEIGVTMTGDLRYVENAFFVTASGTPVLNVVLMAALNPDQNPVVAAPEEVAAIVLRTLAELETDEACPAWTQQSIRAAEAIRQASADA